MLVAEKVIKQAAVVETATTEAELPYWGKCVIQKTNGLNCAMELAYICLYMNGFNLW